MATVSRSSATDRILNRVNDGLSIALGQDTDDCLHWSPEDGKLRVSFTIEGFIEQPQSIEGAFEKLYALIQDRANLVRHQLGMPGLLRPVFADCDCDLCHEGRECESLDEPPETEATHRVLFITRDHDRPAKAAIEPAKQDGLQTESDAAEFARNFNALELRDRRGMWAVVERVNS